MADFAIEKTSHTITQVKGNRFQKKFFPAAGNTAAVVFLEVAPGNKAAVASLVSQITALAETAVFKQWTATAEEGKRPGVDVRMLVLDDEPLPVEEP